MFYVSFSLSPISRGKFIVEGEGMERGLNRIRATSVSLTIRTFLHVLCQGMNSPVLDTAVIRDLLVPVLNRLMC